jgi:UDP:flavonoid glycosyltransferase YjiC (YdhE family)
MKKIKVDFVVPPFSGHLNPQIELALPLLNKNFEIRFITGPNKVEFLKQLGFNAIPVLKDNPNAFENIVNSSRQIKNNPLFLLKQIKETAEVFAKVKDEVEKLIKENQTDIIVGDFMAMPVSVISKELNLPWITTIPTPFIIETKTGVPAYFGGLKYSTSLKSKIINFICRKITHIFKKILILLTRREAKKINFTFYREDGTEAAYSNYSILGLGMEEFEFPRDWPKCFKLIGPCCYSPEKKIDLNIPFSKYQKKVLVTLGTHVEWAKDTLINDVKFLAYRFPNTLFVISFGRTKNLSSNPTFHENNILAFEYIPYTQYLDSFDAVIHHGGAGIVYNCIKYLKPSLVIPHDYDQFDFCARVEYHKLGIGSKKINSNKTSKALKEILENKNIENLKQMNSYMSKYNPSLSLENEILRLVK